MMPAFVGRQVEHDRLAQALRTAIAGEPAFVILDGEAGVGKSRLVAEFAELADDMGALVLTGACVDLGEDGVPLGPMIGVLDELVRRIGAEALFDLLPGAEGLASLLPSLENFARVSEPAQPGRLFHLLAALLERLSARQPVCLIIEDVHWAGRSTRGLLDMLARTLRDAALLVVITCRTDGIRKAHPVRPFLAELERLPGVQRIQLERFSRDETARFLAGLLGRPPSTARLDQVFTRSGGNAFIVQELARTPRSSSLAELLLSSVNRLSEPAAEVVRLAAVRGARVPHQLLRAVSPLPEDELTRAVREAVDASVLIADGDEYVFRHALLREVVYDSLLPAERKNPHRRYAEALEARPGLAPAAEIAHHWRLAEEPDHALPALVHAADAAASLRAYHEQYQALARALDLWPQVTDPALDRLSIVESAATAARLSGAYAEALDLADQALAELDHEREPERAATMLAHRARALLYLGRSGVLATAEQAERLTAHSRSAVRAMTLDLLNVALMGENPAGDAISPAREAAAIADELGDAELQVTTETALGSTLALHHHFDEARAVLASARARAEEQRDLASLARIQVNLAYAELESGRYAQAIEAGHAGQDIARGAGLWRRHGSHSVTLAAVALYYQGRWDEAEERLAEMLTEEPLDLFAVFPHVIAGDLAVARGEVETAKGHLAIARELSTEYGLRQGRMIMGRLAARIALLENRPVDARADIAEALATPWPMDAVTDVWATLALGAQVEGIRHAHTRVFPGEATQDGLLDALRAKAAGLPATTPPWLAMKLQYEAELDSFDAPSTTWGQVVTAWQEAGVPHFATYARVRAAEAAVLGGRRADAKTLLRTAVAQAEQLGAEPLVTEARLYAQRLGLHLADIPRESDSPLQRLSLTPKETEVLRLITHGYSNRKVATELFITEKTASVHVTRILRKLDLNSRGEAAALAHRLRLFDDAGESRREGSG